MALIKDTRYVRVENIELGKNLMRFYVREYTDTSKPPVKEDLVVAEFKYSSNPFAEAYEFLKGTSYKDFKADTDTFVEEPAVKKTPAKSSKKTRKE